MKIKSIIIEHLFEIFNYNISFGEDENILIITGPNGFGKTKVLNIVFCLFNRKFQFFQELSFNKITLLLDADVKIVISNTFQDNKQKDISFSFLNSGGLNEKDQIIETINFNNEHTKKIVDSIEDFLPIRRIGKDEWIHLRTEKRLSLDLFIHLYAYQLPNDINNNIWKIQSNRVNEILNSIQVHLIKEQRLFKEAPNEIRNSRDMREQTVMTETIQTCSKELIQLIYENSQKSFLKAQTLDSSYPERLIKETNVLSKTIYEERYNILTEKLKKLTEYGLYEAKQEVLSYSENDAKALSVYLKDLESKLSEFDSLLYKLDIFTTILNERRFTFKSIKINRDRGFLFETNKGKELELTQLSSGEQHEVVLLYELIFNVKPNVLVLIDEPEISLHISWQKEFLNDLIKISKLQNIQVLIATHSPSIINGRWDLVRNLEFAE